ncbi:hypothetical protein GQ457_02G038000 [Hibiscus cannabinus]
MSCAIVTCLKLQNKRNFFCTALMNNVLGFAVLLALVYARGLTWEFSGEVLVVLMVCLVMGLIASFSSNFPLWMSFLAFVLYPLSLFLVYFLNDVLNYD